MKENDLPATTDFYCDFVLNNKLTVEKVAETERVLAYYHTRPNWTVHIVIIPKQHIAGFIELEDMSIIQEIFEVAQNIIREKGFTESNYKIIANGGSFQDSQHLHFHLVSGKINRSF